MVSITGVSAGQASHYFVKDSYYAAKEIGQWQGKGAEQLGLQGKISKEDFEKLIHGKAPDDSFETQNGGEGHNHRAGVDLTFSGPKSVSVLSEILGEDRVREAHERAVSESLHYVEKHFAQARQTENGITEKVDTDNLIITKFEHNTSRELDPQLHTHTVIMNMTQRDDGEWRAMSNEKLFEHKMLIGQIYRNEFAVNLRELGYSIQSDHKGLFEIQGIDQKILDHFSQRSEQIDAKIRELKESGVCQNASDQKLREIATLGSRVAKQDVDLNIVRERWTERLQEQGYTKEQLQQSIEQVSEQSRQVELNRTESKMNEYDVVRQNL
ncbi:MAG: relaxase domain-containing protein [Nitrospirae bacterium]|nr:relaxase domain-containing protein [Nitrospirota bacterium]